MDGETRIFIAMPALREVMSWTAMDLARLMHREGYTEGYMPKLPYLYTIAELRVVRTSILPKSRHHLVDFARDANATHILWIDADMTFPETALERLMERDQLVVGANYPRRSAPYQPTAQRDGKLIYEEGQTGLEPVDALGLGFCLMRMEVFEKLRPPWFAFPWKDGQYLGEDIFLCLKIRDEIGEPIYVDHDLSHEIGHMGDLEVRWEHARRARAADSG